MVGPCAKHMHSTQKRILGTAQAAQVDVATSKLRFLQWAAFRRVALLAAISSIAACAGSRKEPEPAGGTTSAGGISTATLAASQVPAPAQAPSAASNLPTQGMPCEAGNTCAPGLTCVVYYGIAGPAGPKFTSCEIKCSTSGKPPCPTGQNCVTIADGPGAVCRQSDM
jgi:hypothetical protein